MTTLAEIDVVINAKLDPLLAAGKKAELIIRDLDKRLNAMATKTYTPKINVQADTKKLDEVIGKLNQIAGKNVQINTKPAVNSINSLRSSVAGIATAIGAGFGVREITEYADAWTNAGNKIKSAAEGAGVQTRTLEELNDLASESRAGFEETVDLYAKLTRAASGVAKSESEIALATSTITKAMKAAGATTNEAKSAILQLGQALGSGVLQGDELRSIRENSPLLARAIAKEFNTTVAGLKKLGSEGKLVSDRVFKAILAAAPAIAKQFETTNQTISGSFVNLRNQVTEFIGKLNETYGISQTVGTVMGALAGNIRDVAAAAAAASIVLLSPLLVTAAAALLNPWVLLAAAVGVAAYAVSDFWDETVRLEGSTATLGDYFTATWGAIKDGAYLAKESVVAAFNQIAESIVTALSGTTVDFSGIVETIRTFVNGTIQIFVNMKDSIAIAFNAIGPAVASGVVGAINSMVSLVVQGLNIVIEKTNVAIAAISRAAEFFGGAGIGAIELIDPNVGQLENDWAGAGEAAAKAFGEVWSRDVKDYAGDAITAVKDNLAETVTATGTAFKKDLDAITQRANQVADARREMQRETNRALGLGDTRSNSGKDSTAGFGGGIDTPVSGKGGGKGKKGKESDYQKEIEQIKERTAALVAETQAQAAVNPLIDDYGFASNRAKAAQDLLTAAQKSGVAAGKELKDVQQLLNGEFDNLSPAAREQAQAMLELATKYGEAEAASDRLKESQDRARQAMEDTKQLGKDVLSGFINDLKAGKSASEALSNALNKVADKLLDVGLNMLLGINQGNGGGSGIFGSLLSGLFGGFRAEGGDVSSNKAYVVGEQGPEVFKPSRSGVIIPNNQLKPSVGGAGSTQVQVTLAAQTDSSVIMEIADTQIKSRAPAIVKTSVQQSQQQTKQNMPGFLANAQARKM